MTSCFRVQNAEAVALVTTNEGVRGGKVVPLKKTANEALKDGSCPSLKHTFITYRTDNKEHVLDSDIDLVSTFGTFASRTLEQRSN